MIDLKFMLAEQKERNPRAKFTRSRTLGWFYEMCISISNTQIHLMNSVIA